MSTIFSKCKAYHSKPNSTTFPELPAVTTWLRFLISGMYGISLGLRLETRGLIGTLLGLNVITFLPMFWFNVYLDADVNSYKSLNFVGVPNAFAFMLLTWIFIFTWEHPEEEISLRKVISEAAMRTAAVGESADEFTAEEFSSGQAADLNDEF